MAKRGRKTRVKKERAKKKKEFLARRHCGEGERAELFLKVNKKKSTSTGVFLNTCNIQAVNLPEQFPSLS